MMSKFVAKLFITNPSEVDLTLEITMSLKYWKRLQEQIEGAPHFSPGGRLSDQIDAMRSKANLSIGEEAKEREDENSTTT